MSNQLTKIVQTLSPDPDLDLVIIAKLKPSEEFMTMDRLTDIVGEKNRKRLGKGMKRMGFEKGMKRQGEVVRRGYYATVNI